jgi:hypothetical protein
MKLRAAVWDPVRDLANVKTVDKRHADRVIAVTRRAVSAPGASFPRMMENDAELEGAYRLFSNRRVSPAAIFEAHFSASATRVRAAGARVVVTHDTTACSFGGEGERAELGTLANNGNGLAVHVALALSTDGLPFGLLDVRTHTRLAPVDSKKTYRKRPPSEKESARWAATVDDAMRRVGAGPEVVHVMDREADSYLLLDHLCEHEQSFVIRVCQERRIVDDEHEYLQTAIETIDASVEREVPLSPRSNYRRQQGAKETHPPRDARVATLAIGARTFTIQAGKTHRKHASCPTRTLNVVRVWEPTPVDGEPAVEWRLITNLPIETPEQLEQIIDCYRLRWRIEEFFKALKTGCAFENRQLESRHALENALAILAPVACRLLLLRSLARRTPSAPATAALSATQLEVLRAISKRFKLAARPTIREALFAIAGLGGFLKRNGEPGWQTIGGGFERLLEAVAVWNAAKGLASSDQ